MKPELQLMIPGPTPVPQEVLTALARPPIGHRSEAFQTLMQEIFPRLQWLFQTTQPVFVYAASGTGAMEAALVNTVNAGESIVVLSCGVFSDRWAEIAKSLGIQVHCLSVEPGQPNTVESLHAFLKNHSPIKAVCLIHSETSTGVLNPVAELANVVRENSDALVIVDTVTGLGAAPFYMDQWGIDIAVSGSQKGLMLQAGLAFLAVSERAMSAHQHCRAPGYYFNFSQYQKGLSKGQTPYTPAISLCVGLQAALDALHQEGLQNIYRRHQLNQTLTRAGITGMGLSLFVPEDAQASPSVTSVISPVEGAVPVIRKMMRETHGLIIADGQKTLQGRIFRIGHLGAIFPRDILMTLSCLEVVCHQAQYLQEPLGSGIRLAQQALQHAIHTTPHNTTVCHSGEFSNGLQA